MYVFVDAFLISLLISFFLILSNSLHSHFTNDHDFNSIQKFHFTPVPRIGGVALLLGLFFVYVININHECANLLRRFIFASIPIFTVGLLEDITNKMPAKFRLYISFFSAALIYFLCDIHFVRIDFPLLDNSFFSLSIISFLCTLLVISATIHALNLIDGFNGLMLGCSVLMFGAIAWLSYLCDDSLVLSLSLTFIGINLGLFVFNFPFGKIFSGDSGAYLIGFLLSTTVLLLVQRNPQISAWFPCLLIIYPIFETLFSIYRKVFLRKMTAMQPDGVHLHMLIYKRICRHKKFSNIICNSLTAPYLWALSAIGIIPAVLFWDNTLLTITFCMIFAIVYLRIYWYLVLFKDQTNFLKFLKVNTKENQLAARR